MKFPGNVRSKLPKVGTSIFAVMSKMANENNAINLSQGFPDFACSPELIDLIGHYMKKGYNQYAPMPGIMSLREAIANKMEELYSAKYDPDTEITITSGATQAIYTAVSSVVKENDEVLVFQPAYDCYVPAIEMCGAIPVYAELQPPEYRINWNEVEKLLSTRTKMIIINSPHNPSGSILTANDMMRLEKLTKNSEIVIVSDEVYEHIIFDGYEHQSVARYPELAKRSLITYSFGKTYHATGWKMGYCMGPKDLMKEFRKVHQFMVFSCNTPLQHAYADFMNNKEYYTGLSEFYQQKRDYFLQAVEGSKFKAEPALGTYFQLLNYADISEEKDTVFAEKLTKEFGVASIPISVFYNKPVDNKMLRFCFAKSEETMDKAAELLHKV